MVSYNVQHEGCELASIPLDAPVGRSRNHKEMTMNDDQIKANIDRVKALTAEAMKGPLELDSVAERLGGINIYVGHGHSHEYGVMRGIAERVLPNSWEFNIVEMLGGKCEIIVTRV